ncbi:MAG: transposase [Dehalococcoidales bacterium]
MCLISSFGELLLECAPVMTAPSFQTFLMVATGWLFAWRRTVTGIIQAAGVVGRKHHSAFHRFFAAARWSLDELGLTLLKLVLCHFGADETVSLAVDDTLARKRGLKIFGVGMHLDPALSCRRTKVVNWGHSWVLLGVLVRFPFAKDRWFCLPILFRLYRSKQTVTKRGGVYRTRPELAVEMLQRLCQRYPARRFHLLGDSAYSGRSVVRQLPEHCDFTGRLHLDARLYEPAPPRSGRGRPRVKGARLATPRQMLDGRCRHEMLDIYGRHDRVRLSTTAALWYPSAGSRLLRVVAVEPLRGGRKPQAFFSTCADADAVQVLTWYAMRWSLEVAIQESKGRLGFEEPQGWTKQAVERTAPMAMLLYGLIVLWFAREGHRHLRFPNRPWYRQKRHASFADMLTTLRRCCLKQTFLNTPEWNPGSLKIMHSLVELCSRAA